MEHSFNIFIAKKYGVNSAVLLKNIYFWIEKNRANEKNFYDGNYWTYNSKKAFAELFPYMNARQIDYALKKLIDDDLIITGNYNKVAYDRTLWYAITKKGYSILQNCEMDETKMQNGINEIEQPIPDKKTNNKQSNINTDNKSDVCVYIEQHPLETKKFKVGTYNNVLISNEEISKLSSEFGEELTRASIEYLSEYIEMKGSYKVKSHYLAIRRWVIDAVKKQTKSKQPNEEPVAEQQVDARGTHKNVYLTDKEYNLLAERVQEITNINDIFIALEKVEEAVEFLSDYLHNNPNKKYASHYKAICDWVFTALKERELKAQELELKEQEIAQRQERVERVAERNEQFGTKRISDMTHQEYLDHISQQENKPAMPMYNWLEN